MADKRIVKADEIIPAQAGGSLMDKLRKRRVAIEEGDASGGDSFKPDTSVEDHQRGYTKEKWE